MVSMAPSSFLALARSTKKGANVSTMLHHSALQDAKLQDLEQVASGQPIGKFETAHSFVQVLLHVSSRLKTGSSRVKWPAANFASEAEKSHPTLAFHLVSLQSQFTP